jgi:hypothetical protein
MPHTLARAAARHGHILGYHGNGVFQQAFRHAAWRSDLKNPGGLFPACDAAALSGSKAVTSSAIVFTPSRRRM